MSEHVVPPPLPLQLNDAWNQWVQSCPRPPKLWILTPCYGCQTHVNYVADILNTSRLLEKIGLPYVIEFCKNDSLVPRARNNLLAKAMSDPAMTHVLFIDADIHWSPVSILQLMMSNRGFVGGVYPQKKYTWDALMQDQVNSNPVKTLLLRHESSLVKNMTSPQEYVRHNLVKYNVNYLQPTMDVVDSTVEVLHLPTGFLLVCREAIQQMQEAYPETKYKDDVGFLTEEEGKQAFALFDCGVVDGHYYSEDWMFCHRWRKGGGKVYMHVAIPLTHSGMEDYAGFVLSSLS